MSGGPTVVYTCPRGIVTDFGEAIVLTAEDGDVLTLPRYGVWKQVAGLGKLQVTLTTDDLGDAVIAADA